MGCTVGVAEWRAFALGRLQFSAVDRRQIAATLREQRAVMASR